jgi:recombination protein RecA
MSPGMKENLDVLLGQIDKKFGKGTMQHLTDKVSVNADDIIHTGSIALDTALGIGGYPKGRIVEIYGDESVGKSTLCLQAVSEAQKKGLTCVYIDMEHALDAKYAEALGCDLSKLIISQPDYGEAALEIVNLCARSGEVDLIVVDSVAALTPKAELEGEITDNSIGVQARMMSKAMRMITGNLNKNNCTIIFTNQIRMKIGVMYGSPRTTPGGNALKFYASVRLEMYRGTPEKDGENTTGHMAKVKVVKNKMAPPLQEAEFVIAFGKGVDQTQEILDMAVKDGLIVKAGSWYKYNGESISQGRPGAVQWLDDNAETKEKIKNEIFELRGLN